MSLFLAFVAHGVLRRAFAARVRLLSAVRTPFCQRRLLLLVLLEGMAIVTELHVSVSAVSLSSPASAVVHDVDVCAVRSVQDGLLLLNSLARVSSASSCNLSEWAASQIPTTNQSRIISLSRVPYFQFAARL